MLTISPPGAGDKTRGEPKYPHDSHPDRSAVKLVIFAIVLVLPVIAGALSPLW
jgi:hypothetical protein